jgi:tyrosinase
MSAFGYSYPEISDWNQSPSELATNVTAQINALYGPSSGNRGLRARHYSSSLKEWFVDISVDMYELGDQFIVWIFLGEVPADSGSWKYSTNLVGSLGVFPPPLIKQNKGESTSYGEVALLDALNRAGLPNQDDATLIEFLTKYLQWRVEKV